MNEELEKPCIISIYPKDKDGYARIKKEGHHRLVYREFHEVDITGKIVRHKCDNPPCIEITHLEIGTPADNSKDMVERGRSNKGTRNGSSVFTEAAVLDIRDMHEEGYSQLEIAKEFGVDRKTVNRIVRRQVYRDL